MRMLGDVTPKPSTRSTLAGGETLVGGDISKETLDLPAPALPQGSKLRMSIEKQIENIWLESEELGWDFNDFVTHLMEVLIVLNYRGIKIPAKKPDLK
jgi:hypothetical protein